jgi:hypothetical protein
MAVVIAGNILAQSNSEPVPISMGGTGQSTAPTAINALLPVQTGQSGKILVTNGTNVSWSSVTMTPGGSDTMIQYNDSGSFGGNAFLVVNKSTGAITSTSTFKGIGLTISDAEATNRTLRYQTAGSDRWLMMANNTAETGAASGSDFACVRVADNGATTNIVYEINRATGVFDFKVTPTVNGAAISSSTAASALTGTTLASNVVSSSLTSVGTITSGTWSGSFGTVSGANLTNITGANVTGTVANATNATNATNAGNATSATSAVTAVNIAGGGIGYVPYQTASGSTGFLNAGTSGYVLTSNGTGVAPTWSVPQTPAYPLNQIVYGTGTSSSSYTTLTYDPTTNILTVGGTGVALVEAGTSQALRLLSDTAIYLATGTVGSLTDRIVINTNGSIAVNGSTGTSGQVLASAGSGAAAGWTSSPTLSGANITSASIPNSALTNSSVTVGSTAIALGASSTTLAGLTSVTSTSFTGALTGHASSDVALSGGTMTGLLILSADPTDALGAVTKQYADAIASGVQIHAACETATAAPLASCTYNNGTGGLGATLTATANGNLGSIGGYTPVGGWLSTSRILVKDQVAGLQNGIYTVTQAGSGSLPFILTRATDFDGSPTSEVGPGDLTFIQEGSLAGTQWAETAVGTGTPGDYIIIGTDSMTFGQFSGASAYTAGTGISIASNVITNTGVTSIVAGTGISISGGTGSVTVTSTSTGFTSTDDNTTNATYYPALVTTAGGSTVKTASTQISFNPSTATLTVGGNAVGYLTVPQNTQGSYTLVLADSGKHIFTSSGGAAWVIPANSSVAFPIGTAVTFVNQSATPCTVAITSDTLYLAGAGTTGTRTVGTYGIATAMKTSATTWIISGTSVT